MATDAEITAEIARLVDAGRPVAAAMAAEFERRVESNPDSSNEQRDLSTLIKHYSAARPSPLILLGTLLYGARGH